MWLTGGQTPVCQSHGAHDWICQGETAERDPGRWLERETAHSHNSHYNVVIVHVVCK